MDPRSGDFDAWLDARLRDVPVPDGLADRLRAISHKHGRAIDHALCAVEVPADLLARLRAVPLEDDAVLDAALGRVSLPESLLTRLWCIPLGRTWQDRLTRVALAASVLLAVSLSVLGGVALYVARLSGLEQAAPPPLLAGRDLTDPTEQESWDAQADLSEQPEVATGLSADEPPLPTIHVPPPKRAAPGLPAVARDMPADWLLGTGAAGRARINPFLGVAPRDWPLAVHASFDELPDLKKVAAMVPRGMRTPLAPGFDLAFFLRWGVHPFVAPANPKLQTSSVPLGVVPSSFDLVRRCVEDGELPPPAQIRTEEFLAAQDYGYGRPKKASLALHAAGGPSPFGAEAQRLLHGGDTLRMLHVGVQAQDLVRQPHPPARLTLAVDTSASMCWGGRLETVCRAMGALVGRLDAQDRVSLVVFNEQARRVAQGVGRGDAEPFRAALAGLTTQGSTNVGAGLREAYELALHEPIVPGDTHRVVLLTDGLTELDRASGDRLDRRLAEAAAQGVRLEVIDLGQELEVEAVDRQLDRLARAGLGQVRRAADVDQVRWALEEILTGKPQQVARDVLLRVTFNPGAVWEYRLFGHEAAAVAGLLPARPETDFYAGQSATALYEIRLRPGGGKDTEVATVELRWRDAATGQPGSITRKITRRDLVPTLGKAPPWFQQSAFAAEVAEVLRESPYARLGANPGSLGRALDLLAVVDSRLIQRPAFAELVALARQAEKVKPLQRGVRR